MSKSTLRKEIENMRANLINSELDFRIDNSDNRSITFWNNDSDLLADSVDAACDCDVSQTEWYKANFSEITNEELVSELEKRYDGEVETVVDFNSITVKF